MHLQLLEQNEHIFNVSVPSALYIETDSAFLLVTVERQSCFWLISYIYIEKFRKDHFLKRLSSDYIYICASEKFCYFLVVPFSLSHKVHIADQ